MPAFNLRPAPTTMPVTGLIVHGEQVCVLSRKLSDRSGLMVAMGDGWLAAFSDQTDVNLPWLPVPPTYLYTLAPGLMCQMGFEPDVPLPLIPSVAKHLAPQGTAALTQGPKLWDFSAATPLAASNLQALT